MTRISVVGILLILLLAGAILVGIALAVFAIVRAAGSRQPHGPNLQPCPDCGKPVSVRATACPHCGGPVTGK
jgi:hypothetical protein